ncbi:hypothetical protein M0G43_10980 [Subsaxibacter sp. CAU 1640]|uniref:hypothetical protein n=1 Tax=Subsaxibacter sp. CAU 1640 TaxID=2933271 RepID=UPI002004226D|nr:hypothetical protein [Subsaxibacter sp. CAU 1640]MCK7591099.1 hypothetical protein [Subsaxibacter sp. CAU 1640]
MKVLLLILIFVSSISLYSQKEKDSLLKRDLNKVLQTLEFMAELEIYKPKIDKSQSFEDYFDMNISKDIDSLKLKIINFLELKKPLSEYTHQRYYEIVYDRIMVEFINLIENYGYPSFGRINRFKTTHQFKNPIKFIQLAKPHMARKLLKIAKTELSLGNMSQLSYDLISWKVDGVFDQRLLTDPRIKQLPKDSIKDFEVVWPKSD